MANDLLDGSVHQDTVAFTVLRGALALGNSTPKWGGLAVGGASTALLSDGTDPSWSTILNAHVNASAAIAYSKMQNTSGISGIRGVVKTADEIVNNSSTMQDDNELLVAIEANGRYEMLIVLRCTMLATSDFKFQFTVPTGTTMAGASSGASQIGAELDLTTTQSQNVTSTTQAYLRYFAIITAGSTAGNVTLQWAQLLATVEDTVVKASSYLLLRRLA